MLPKKLALVVNSLDRGNHDVLVVLLPVLGWAWLGCLGRGLSCLEQ